MPPKNDHGQGHGHSDDAGGAGGFRNHGAEVSAAAHEAPRGRGEQHGRAVSDVARRDQPIPTPANPSTVADVAADDSEPGA